jgi:hypothetical protein
LAVLRFDMAIYGFGGVECYVVRSDRIGFGMLASYKFRQDRGLGAAHWRQCAASKARPGAVVSRWVEVGSGAVICDWLCCGEVGSEFGPARRAEVRFEV